MASDHYDEMAFKLRFNIDVNGKRIALKLDNLGDEKISTVNCTKPR